MKNRFAAILLSAVAVFLASCGGGGVATPPSANTAGLAMQPGTVEMFPDTPTTFTISGGTAPYRVNSSNNAVLPLNNVNVQGNTFVATPNNVATDTTVTLTVTDATGKTSTATATVRVSILLNLLSFTAASGCPTTLCSGGDAIASVSMVQNGVPQTNRAVRFSVEVGAYSLVTPGSGALVNSLTVNADQTGLALATMRAAPATASQQAVLRVTDVSSGQTRLFVFQITQTISNTAISIIPSTATWTGAFSSTCVVGGVSSHYIFGGTPPYSVVSTAPSIATVAPSLVTANGGAVNVTVLGVNSVGQSSCTTTAGVPIVVTDATGRFTTFTIVNTVGTATPPSGGVGALPAPTLNPTSLGPIDCGVSTSAFVTQTIPAGYTGTTPVVLTATSLEPSRLSATIANGVLTVNRLTTGGPGTAPIIVRVSNGVTYTDVDVALVGTAPYGCASAGGSNNPIQVSTTTSLTLKNGTAIPVTIAGGVPPYIVSTSAPTVIQVSNDGSTYYTPGWANIYNTATPPVIVAEGGWSCIQPTLPLPSAPTLPTPTPSTGPTTSTGVPLGLTGMGIGPGQNGNTCYIFVGTPNSQLTNQFTLRALLTNAVGQVGFVTITDSSSPTRFTQVIVVTVN